MNIAVHLKYGNALRTGNDSFIHWVGADTEEFQENDEQQQQVKRMDTKNFSWKIENFSSLTETKVYSDPFVVGGHNWRVFVYPKGEEDDDDMSVYLEFADKETMPSGWSVTADFSLALVNQLRGTSTVTKRGTSTFLKGGGSWGWDDFVPVKDLCTKGFLVNDILVIEAEVSTEAIVSEANDDAKEFKVTQPSIDIQVETLSPQLEVDNPDKANGNVSSSFSPSTVQSTTRSLIAQLSSGIIIPSSNPGHDSELLQQKNEKLHNFFDKSLECLCQTKSLDEVDNTVHEILALASDRPLHKAVLEELISRLAEFKESVPSHLSTVETCQVIETSKGQVARDLEEKLVYRKCQLTSLDAEVTKLGEEGSKLDVEIQQLTDRRAEIRERVNSTAGVLEKANREASKEMDELKKENVELKEAAKNRMRAMEELAKANASWKLFKNLEWQ